MPPKERRVPLRKEWMFTIFEGHLTTEGQTLDQYDLWLRDNVPNGVKYLVFQREVSPTTFRDHLQGFLAMSQQKRPTTLGQLFKVKPQSFQGNRGTPQENRAYCTDDEKRKDGASTFEWGEMPGGRGKRTDLDKAAELLKSDDGLKRVYSEMPSVAIKYHAGIEKVYNHHKRARLNSEPIPEDPCFLVVAWGTPGSGKSHWSNSFDPDNTFTLGDMHKGGQLWLTGYEGQRTLLIEDYEGEIGYRSLMKMCDKYRMDFQTKGGVVPKQWTNVVITSNQHPRMWYPNQHGDNWDFGEDGPLKRRCSAVVEFRGTFPDTLYYYEGEDEPRTELPMTFPQILAAQEELRSPMEEADPESAAGTTAETQSYPELNSDDELLAELAVAAASDDYSTAGVNQVLSDLGLDSSQDSVQALHPGYRPRSHWADIEAEED